jgi:hypothetical protein
MSSSSLCDDGEHRIKLTPEFQKRFVINENDGFRLRVTASDYCGFLDAKIFRYYRYPETSAGVVNDEFTGVCSWPDLEEVPVDEPLVDAAPQVYRLDYFDIVLATESLAYEVWTLVQEEVSQLVTTLEEGAILEAGDVYWAGGEAP